MAQGRGSASSSMGVAAVLLVCLMLAVQSEMAAAAVYTVGDRKGWTFNMVNWPRGKRFRAGDVLGEYLSFLALSN